MSAPSQPLPRDTKPSDHDDVECVAADWLARRELGLTDVEQEQFSQWLLADPRHAAVAKSLQTAWTLLGKPRRAGQAAAVEEMVARRVRARQRARHRLAKVIAWTGMAAAAALAIVGLAPDRVPPTVAVETVQVFPKPERQILPDGSVVELNAGAEITVTFSAAQRDVRLVRGEALFTVTRNPQRPFVVTAGRVSVRAVGTAFTVRVAPAAVDIVVTEGQVAVDRRPEPASDAGAVSAPPPLFVAAGRKVSVPVDAGAEPIPSVLAISAAEMAVALGWRDKRVEFTNVSLRDVAELLNRQNRVKLVLDSDAVADICISGIYWTDDTEGFSRLIATSADLQATRISDDRIHLRHP